MNRKKTEFIFNKMFFIFFFNVQYFCQMHWNLNYIIALKVFSGLLITLDLFGHQSKCESAAFVSRNLKTWKGWRLHASKLLPHSTSKTTLLKPFQCVSDQAKGLHTPLHRWWKNTTRNWRRAYETKNFSQN